MSGSGDVPGLLQWFQAYLSTEEFRHLLPVFPGDGELGFSYIQEVHIDTGHRGFVDEVGPMDPEETGRFLSSQDSKK